MFDSKSTCSHTDGVVVCGIVYRNNTAQRGPTERIIADSAAVSSPSFRNQKSPTAAQDSQDARGRSKMQDLEEQLQRLRLQQKALFTVKSLL